jgi:DNA-binding CsgD family transcriptional regulator
MSQVVDIQEFLRLQQEKLSDAVENMRGFEELSNFPLTNEQCLYVHDFKKKAITYQRNVRILLGYNEKEFNSDLIHSYFHPEDENMVLRLIKAAVTYVTEQSVWGEGIFSLTFRLRKKDGAYMKVLRQSRIFQMDEKGIMISNMSVLSDIGFINSGTNVDWRFNTKDYDEAEFRKYVGQQYNSYFTPRELEIIQWINEGLSSKDIANENMISSHTVDTHRRKILKKAGCKNTIELLNFCNKIGVLR